MAIVPYFTCANKDMMLSDALRQAIMIDDVTGYVSINTNVISGGGGTGWVEQPTIAIGQTVITTTEELGTDYIVFIDGAVQALGLIYTKTDVDELTFVAPFIGGENVIIVRVS